MTFEEFSVSAQKGDPPTGVTPALAALWHDRCGDWTKAHEIAQSIQDSTGSWVHAYLHRKEGDPENAAYWYTQAGQPIASDSLDAEWTRIARTLLTT